MTRNTTVRRHCATAVVLGLGMGIAHLAMAQESSKIPTKEDLIEILTPDETGHVRGGRGLNLDERTLNFEFGSAVLNPDAKALLDNIAGALLTESLESIRYRIAGHTDAVGSEAANLDLSRRRAKAVESYLVEKGVALQRLETVGFGETDLADSANPNSGVNRRVVIDVANQQ